MPQLVVLGLSVPVVVHRLLCEVDANQRAQSRNLSWLLCLREQGSQTVPQNIAETG